MTEMTEMTSARDRRTFQSVFCSGLFFLRCGKGSVPRSKLRDMLQMGASGYHWRAGLQP